jgi:hypothetical protein
MVRGSLACVHYNDSTGSVQLSSINTKLASRVGEPEYMNFSDERDFSVDLKYVITKDAAKQVVAEFLQTEEPIGLVSVY